MKITSSEKIDLWPDGAPFAENGDGYQPYMESFLVKTGKPSGAVIVLPGGGYHKKMITYEGRDVCKRLNEYGLNAFMLEYRVSPNRHPAPLLDAAESVRIVRRNAARWNIRPDKIAVLGFSAGGHLAGSICVHSGWAEKILPAKDNVSARPDAGILCYAVLSTQAFGHPGCYKNLLGENPDKALLDKMSLELNVHSGMPPVFLWHTATDPVVPVENSLLFATAMSSKKVPFELHIYPQGPHGMGMAQGDSCVSTWVDLCIGWLKKNAFL
ncbi:MAG TPA: alpha/beta hydrolase [Lentisphaeria bacterium]|nr:MAG: hypothetical protein A2X45_14270 [Lentisphaerae bacterium GWF2_50_93]HCE44993.1 alpha/beta hydrolase [Lentisphaeria bacterium]